MSNIENCVNHVDCFETRKANKGLFSSFQSKIGQWIKTTYQTHRQKRIDRDAFKSLFQLDERALKDIGVTHADLIWASKLSINKSASNELEKIRAQNIATARSEVLHK